MQWYNDYDDNKGDDDNYFMMIMKVMMMTTWKDLVAPVQVCNPKLSWHGKIPRSRVNRYQIFDIIIILLEEYYGDLLKIWQQLIRWFQKYIYFY